MSTSFRKRRAIHVDRVSKRFRLGAGIEYSRLTEALAYGGWRWLRSAQQRLSDKSSTEVMPPSVDSPFQDGWFWALRDIDFSVDCGEVVGVIGRNGAGKSTLLKILSRIVTPTSGRVGVRGRVGSLLEVGTGFHPELTGRENVFLNGAILGLRRSEIRKRFDEIVAFAEIEPFLDTPVKRYSSGMTVRLGFSVAAHMEPDVLIVDEVLSVGDQAFQRKCMGKASELGAQGRTVLVVSHNLAAIATMCSRAVLIDQGRLLADATPQSVIERYLQSTDANAGRIEWGNADAPQSDAIRLRSVSVLGTASETPTSQVDIDRELVVSLEYEVLRAIAPYNIHLQLKDESGVLVLASGSLAGRELDQEVAVENIVAPENIMAPGTYRTQCQLPSNLLNDCRYWIGLYIGPEGGSPNLICDPALSFSVHDTSTVRREYFGTWTGPVVRPKLGWRTESIDLNETFR